MPLPNPRRRRRRRRVLNNNVVKKQKSAPSFTGKWLCEHLHETRSKTARNSDSQTVLTDSAIISRRSSNSSVVCLGSFHKVPELVILEDSGDNCEAKMACTQQEIKSSRSQKMEPTNTKSLVK